MAPKTDVIEQLRERVRELEEENARLKRTNSSYASLTKAQESQLTNLRQRLYQLKGADSAIDSERQANCELTEQLAAAQEEWNQCSGLLDDAHRSIEMLEDQLAKAEQRVAEWQPIETAPKDCDLLVTDGRKVYLGQWVGRYFAWGYSSDPTHWMPLPKAPANGASS